MQKGEAAHRGGNLPAAAVPGGGARGEVACRPCHSGTRGGGLAFLLARLPCLHLFSAPLSPHPPSPVGKGETKVIFMQGASPLASRGLNPRGAYSPCQSGAKRGACLFCRLPTLSLAYFPAPIPLPPFPPGRGRILLYFAGGSAPGTPATGWDAALVFPVESRFRRWACPVGRLLTLPLWYPAGGARVLVAR